MPSATSRAIAPVGMTAMGLSLVLGTLVGVCAGFLRGLDGILMRLTDLFLALPLLPLLLVMSMLFREPLSQWLGAETGIFLLIVTAIGGTSWMHTARLVRGEVLSLREREFVMAARAIGTPSWRIILRHILPNTLGTIIVNATLLISAAILLESGLSFLGFGVQAPDTSLGLLVSQYQGAFTTRPWLFWWPGILILAIALCVNFIGDGLRDAFDPRQKLD